MQIGEIVAAAQLGKAGTLLRREFQTTNWQAAFIILASIVQFRLVFVAFKNRNSIREDFLKMQRLSKSTHSSLSPDALHSQKCSKSNKSVN
jgi:hypothetical protein